MRHLFVLIFVTIASVATATNPTYNWQGLTSTDWDDPSNWIGTPGHSVYELGVDDLFIVQQDATVNFDLALRPLDPQIDRITSLTINLASTLNHKSGTLLANQVNVTGASTYEMTGGVLGASTSPLALSVTGDSYFNISNGAHATVALQIGGDAGGTAATITVDGSTTQLDITGQVWLGGNGHSSFTQKDGQVTITPNPDTIPAPLVIDNSLGTTQGLGLYDMQGGTLTIDCTGYSHPGMIVGYDTASGGSSTDMPTFILPNGNVTITNGSLSIGGQGLPAYSFVMQGGGLTPPSLTATAIKVGTDDPTHERALGLTYSRFMWTAGDVTTGAITVVKSGGLALCLPRVEADPMTITRASLSSTTPTIQGIPLTIGEGILDITNGCRVVQHGVVDGQGVLQGVPLAIGRLHIGTQRLREGDEYLEMSDGGSYTLKGHFAAHQPAITTRGISIGPRYESKFEVNTGGAPEIYQVNFTYAYHYGVAWGDDDGVITPPGENDFRNYCHKFLLGQCASFHVAQGSTLVLHYGAELDGDTFVLGNHVSAGNSSNVDGLQSTEVEILPTAWSSNCCIEAAGTSHGEELPLSGAFCASNFMLKKLVLGPETLTPDPAHPDRSSPIFSIMDEFDNQGVVNGNEAVYVDMLVINYARFLLSYDNDNERWILFNGHPLYYLNSGSPLDPYPKRLVLGDANLDGVVDCSDVGLLAANWGKPHAKWTEGNFDGASEDIVNPDQTVSTVAVGWADLSLLAQEYDYSEPIGLTLDQSNAKFAVPDSSIHTMLTSLNLSFTGSSSDGDPPITNSIEAAGAMPAGDYVAIGDFSESNHTINQLTIGGGSSAGTKKLVVQNVLDNTNHYGEVHPEALYVRTLNIGAGGTFSSAVEDSEDPSADAPPVYYLRSSDGAPVRLWRGDANLDGQVDVVDLGILTRNYGTATGATWAMGDFNGDGAVDVIDLSILARYYGSGGEEMVAGGEMDEVDKFLYVLDMMDYAMFVAGVSGY